jgi:hypothetical protein
MACVAVMAALMALGGHHPVAASPLRCPEDTTWDGYACAHARATCGGWDGLSCTPGDSPAAERQSESDFATIERDASAICDEEDETSTFAGSVGEVLRATDRAMSDAAEVEKRLQELGDSRSTPRWRVATAAGAGSLYDCIRGRFARANPSLLTAQQQALLTKLQKLAIQLQQGPFPASAQSVRAQVQDTVNQIRHKWLEQRDRDLGLLAGKAVRPYVTAALLARRYALEGFDLTRARWRLPVLGRELGAETMTEILRDMCDPTTANAGSDCHHVEYFARAFD